MASVSAGPITIGATLFLLTLASTCPANAAGVEEALAEARALAEDLEYEKVLEIVPWVLNNPEVSEEQKLEAYFMQGSALAIVGSPVDAENPFRLLLRAKPDFEIRPELTPKIVAVFRKVEAEERAIREQLRAMERARILKEMELVEIKRDKAIGGTPLRFEYKLRDPRSSVDGFHLLYRRHGDKSFSSLAFNPSDTGAWAAEIAPTWTESSEQFVIEYYLRTTDRVGDALLVVGSEAQPLSLDVAPGTVAAGVPFYRRPWFWVLTGVAAVGLGVGTYFVYDRATRLPDAPLGTVTIEP